VKKLIWFFWGIINIQGYGQQYMDSKKVDALTDLYFTEGIQTLKTFLSIPNRSRNRDEIERNMEWCKEWLKELDMEVVQIFSEGVPHLLANKVVDDSKPTILFYLQIDGQPVDSSLWDQPDPFQPVLKKCQGGDCIPLDWEVLGKAVDHEWKIFARSASDSKGPAVAFMYALKILQQQRVEPAYNVKVIMDFQEELGSPTLPQLVENHRLGFAADAIIIMDGTRPSGNLPTLTFGARGIATVSLTTYGALKNMHSGQYGNYVPNPAFALARLVGGMKDEVGRVLIPGFYEGVQISSSVGGAVKNLGASLQELGLAGFEKVGSNYLESLQYPSLNIRGLKAGWVGDEVRTIIPSEAVAEIDMRLVMETPAERQLQLLRDYIIDQGFYVVDEAPTLEERLKHPKLIRMEYRIGSLPFKTDINGPLGQWLQTIMGDTFGSGNFLVMQTTGGSQPIAPFINTLGIPALAIRIANPDSNIHAPNENIRLGNFYEGIKIALAVLSRPYHNE
jgi:acetylornithine deacetylase/succinyl-diaminopimelate desuccinylase-like protein